MEENETISVNSNILELIISNDWALSLTIKPIPLIALGIILAVIFLMARIFLWKRLSLFEIDSAEFGIGDQKISFRPNTTDRQIAYSIWVELSTRKVGLPIDPDHDVIEEIYNSWYTFFGVTREMIKDIPISKVRGDSTSQIISLSVEVLNEGLSRDFPVGRLYIFPSRSCAGEDKMIDFKGVHHPKSVILYAVFFYLRYAVSYRDLEEIMAERGVRVDHATLNRWVVKFSPLIAARAQARKRSTATSWRVDETYIKVKGKWRYLYRAVDRDGQTLDFMLSHRRDLAAARRFFKQAIAAHGVPDRVVIDKSGANLAGLQAVNVILKFTGDGRVIEVRQVKYLNNILEQDHRFIKRITNPMMGFKAFHSAAATIAGIEAAHMIRKGQIPTNGTTPFQTFASLAA